MTVFPKHLLIAVCLCVISNLCYGELTCTEDSPVNVKKYAAPGNNKLDCRRPFHGVDATYSWKWYDPFRYQYFPISDLENVTIIYNGAGLLFDQVANDSRFKCEIEKPNNELTGPIEYNVVQSQLIQTNQGAPEVHYYVQEYSFITIRCTVEGTFVGDDIRFIWFKVFNDVETFIYSTNRIHVDKRGNLNFSPVLMSDHDMWDDSRYWYKCVVMSTKLGISKVGNRVVIHVSDAGPNRIPTKPVLLYSSDNLQARVNDSIILECVFSNDGPSDLTYKWYRPANEEVGIRSDDVYAFKQRLFIDRVQPNHNGYWYCAAKNTEFSSFKYGIELTVIC